jgi:hypothetical protein
VSFNLTISAWLALFRDVGFGVDDYVEIQAPAAGSPIVGLTSGDWATRFPPEQVWKLRRL